MVRITLKSKLKDMVKITMKGMVRNTITCSYLHTSSERISAFTAALILYLIFSIHNISSLSIGYVVIISFIIYLYIYNF